MKYRLLRLTAVLSLLLTLIPATVFAQDKPDSTDGPLYTVFLPNTQLRTEEDLLPPSPRTLSQQVCDDIDEDGSPEYRYALSDNVFPNGTTSGTIQQLYKMHPQDFGPIFLRFWPQGQINSVTGASAVCLPKHYSFVLGESDNPNLSTRPRLRFNGDRPEWHTYIDGVSDTVSASGIMSSEFISGTYSLVMGIPAPTTVWAGAEVVGSFGLGATDMGSIIKSVPGTVASTVLSEGLNVFVTIYVLYDRLNAGYEYSYANASWEFPNGSSMVYVSHEPTRGYLRCYENVLTASDNMAIPNLVTILLYGTGTNGCLLSRDPQGVEGNTQYSWDSIRYAAAILASELRPIRSEDTASILAQAELILANTNDDPDDDLPLPDVPEGSECPRLLHDQTFLIDAVTIATDNLALYFRTHDNTASNEEQDLQLFDFVDAATYNIHTVTFDDFYNTLRPRGGSGLHLAQLTTIHRDPDEEGNDWAVMGVCVHMPNTNISLWVPNPNFGRVGGGILSSYDPSDMPSIYPYEYNVWSGPSD